MTSWQGADPSEPTQWLQAEAAIARDRSIPIQFHTLSIDPPNERNPLVPEGKLRITVQSEALDDIQRRIASTLHSHGLDVWPPIGSSWIGHVSLVVVPVHVPMDVASRRASAALSKAGMELPVTFDAASLRVHQLSGDDEGIELMRFPTTDSRWQPASPEL